MGWIDNFRQAKFRNVPFYVPGADNSGGRRGAVHEFPKKDIPYVEDMGRKAKQFVLEAYILGEDYYSGRDALIEALDKEGIGKLIHPYYGSIDVFCTNYSYRETVQETRMVRFTMTFIEAGALTYPVSIIDTVNNVAAKKRTALQKIKDAFEKAYSIARVPYTVSQNVISTIDKGLNLIEDTKRVVSAVASFQEDIDNIRGKIYQLAYDVQDLAQEFLDVITFATNREDSFPAAIENVKDQFKEMNILWEFVPEQQIIDEDPAIIFSDYIQQNAVINALGLVSLIEYDSYDEAIKYRDIVFNKLEGILLTVNDDDLYIALYDLKTAVAQDIESRGELLSRLATYRLNNSLPAVVVSHNLYGNIDQEQDIIDRNRIENPNFVPGGIDIEVLINA